jgi:hypothetical protein
MLRNIPLMIRCLSPQMVQVALEARHALWDAIVGEITGA